ncbi:hypothetical protein O7626_20140 [Micromonospora sp. WMMD1102]|uniref:hypothetical protein n=1 Tax=Micromonospora sp. WMMD1102 TaxID=3016105 RepID=UPI0024155ABD|nr:hypothetical protein [Micromonospora sp. WMMD1102]MDG4788221.1 hypothetical protein [Micromonospora sp. WMMD1102]
MTAAALAGLAVAALLVGWRTGSTAAGPATIRPGGGVEVSPAAPPPRIHPFARQPRRKPRPALPSPTAPPVVAEGFDGCDHGYGEDAEICVPWRFPPGVRDRCRWLSARDYPPLRVVRARDRHGLDRNRDGVACGRGD